MNINNLFTIDEVSRQLNLPKHTIRYWEAQFAEFLSPERTSGKHRRFTEEDMEKIKKIKTLLKDEGYSIRGAKKKLQEINGLKLKTKDVDVLAKQIALILKKEFLK